MPYTFISIESFRMGQRAKAKNPISNKVDDRYYCQNTPPSTIARVTDNFKGGNQHGQQPRDNGRRSPKPEGIDIHCHPPFPESDHK